MFGRKKKPTVEKLFETCMKQGTEFTLKATDVATYLRSPFQIYCNYFVDSSEKDPQPDQYMIQLATAGIKHETEINREQFPDAIPVKFATQEEGFMIVLDSMTKGISSFLGAPLFYLPDGMRGMADQLVRVKGKSVFGSYHYVIKEIKIAKNIKESHILQAAFYNYIIGKIQGNTPEVFYIINMKKEEKPFAFADYKEKLFQIIQDVNKIRSGVMPSPTYSSCSYPWSNYCDKIALESKDISLINGIGLEKKKSLLDHNIKNIDDILTCGESRLEEIPRIGKKTAQNYIMSAKALTANKTIQKSETITLPKKSTEIFLDLEGLDALTSDDLGNIQTDYLIGVLVRKGGNEEYIPFVAHSHNKEKEMLNEFLDFMKKQNDYVIYHWHHYEKTHLTKMMDKYGTSQKVQDMVLSKHVLIDLHKITTKQFVFPFPGTGIKAIAKWMGFAWKHNDVDAMNSIGLYLNYVRDSNKVHLNLILDYNRDDCEATKIIKDWLVNQEKS